MAEMASPPFIYGKLRDNEIRLLRQIVTRDDDDSPAQQPVYRLWTFDIENTPDYHALSYCWGTPDRNDGIICNEFRLSVTTMLRQGLADLWAILELQTWFWIDQICINQDDADEQTAQIRLMPAIYSTAIRTVVWLGPVDPVTIEVDERGFALAKAVFDACQNNEAISYRPVFPESSLTVHEWSGRVPAPDGLGDPWGLYGLHLPDLSSDEWPCLYGIFDAPWFSRIWVLQEVFASRREPLLLHGRRLSSFLRLIWAGSFISQNLDVFALAPYSLQPSSRTRARTRHATLFLQLAILKTDWSFESILWRTAEFGATDLRDKFFALASLKDAMERQNPRAEARKYLHLKVPAANYRATLTQVAHQFTVYALLLDSLLILSLVNRDPASRPPSPDFGPTWVYTPSEDFRPLRFGQQYTLISHPYKVLRDCRPINYRYTQGDTVSVPRIFLESGKLVLKGRKFDEISAVAPSSSGKGPKLAWWCEFAHRHASMGLYEFLESFLLAISARSTLLGRRAPLAGDLWRWLRGRSSFSHQPIQSGITGNYFRHIPEESGERLASSRSSTVGIMEKWASLYESGDYQHRAFGFTSLGHMMVGPTAMREGDVVYTLRGELPYVLRPHGSRFMFLGECYIEELRNGSTFKFDKEEEEQRKQWAAWGAEAPDGVDEKGDSFICIV